MNIFLNFLKKEAPGLIDEYIPTWEVDYGLIDFDIHEVDPDLGQEAAAKQQPRVVASEIRRGAERGYLPKKGKLMIYSKRKRMEMRK